MPVELRVGLAGLGAAARQVAPGFETVEGVKFAAVADVQKDEVDRWAEKYDLASFTSVEEMCRSGEVDAIYIATPNDLHAEHTLVAAEHGVHVICEKPMAINMDEAHRMVEVVEQTGVKYIQGHSKIYRPSIRKIGEIIASGRLGRVIQINTWNYNDWLRRPWPEWSLQEEHGGGVVYRQGPHQMDIVLFLGGGMVRSIRATAGRYHRHIDVEGNYSAFLDFENGVTALISFNGYGNFDVAELTWNIGEGGAKRSDEKLYGPREVRTGPVTWDEKYEMEEFSLQHVERRADRSERFEDFFGITVVSCERGDIRQSPTGVYVYTDDGREEIGLENRAQPRGAAEVLELKTSLEENRPTFPGADFGRASLEACMAVLQSSRERREVMLSYQSASPIQAPAEAVSK